MMIKVLVPIARSAALTDICTYVFVVMQSCMSELWFLRPFAFIFWGLLGYYGLDEEKRFGDNDSESIYYV